MTDRPAGNPVRVWLVHGTFAPKASFLSDDSPVRSAIATALFPSDVALETFRVGGASITALLRDAQLRLALCVRSPTRYQLDRPSAGSGPFSNSQPPWQAAAFSLSATSPRANC
jgi:hypothetical protein